jgi:hypothetical protein
MLLAYDKVRIALILLGVVSLGFGLSRTLSTSDHVPPAQMMHQTRRIDSAPIPREAGPWLIVGGLTAFGLCFAIRRK